LTRARCEGFRPGAIAYNAAVSSCQPDRAWAAALGLFVEMWRGQVATGDAGALACGTICRMLRSLDLWQESCALMEGARIAWVTKRLEKHTTIGGTEHSVQEPQKSRREISVLQEGAGVIAVSKPPGIASGRMLERLSSQLRAGGRAATLSSVSRLDFSTSGVLVVALGGQTSSAALWLKAQYAGRLVEKEYLCLCEGRTLGPPGSTGEIDAPLLVKQVGEDIYRTTVSQSHGKQACTRYSVVANYAPMSAPTSSDTAGEELVMLLRVVPLTGRTHQIRAHLASIGRSLVSDPAYGQQRFGCHVKFCPRIFLHCRRVALRDLDGVQFVGQDRLPVDLLDVLSCLQLLEGKDILEQQL